MPKFAYSLLKFGVILMFIVGWYAWTGKRSEDRRAETSERRQSFQDNLNDPSAPPVLSSTMLDPDWSIRKWLAVGQKSSDCAMADEMMDQNATVKIVTRRRGATSRYYLSDYVSSCQNFSDRMFFEIVEPQADKWCQFRQDSDRLEQLCDEWTDNKDLYLQSLRSAASPTIERYQLFIE